jgi:acyl carrier protein
MVDVRDPLLEDLRRIIAEILGLERDTIDMDSGMDKTAGWDSLQQVSVIMAIEEDMSVELTAEELTWANSVRKLHALLASRR